MASIELYLARQHSLMMGGQSSLTIDTQDDGK
jgi:hypothetical protein